MRRPSVIAIPLGEIARAEVESTIEREFGAVELSWLDRRDLRRRPLRTLAGLARRRFDAAVLVATDLHQPRLRLTSFLLGLARAEHRWLIDMRGERETWSVAAHVARHAPAIARHLAACSMAAALGVPALTLIDRAIKPRHLSPGPRQRWLYLRSQLWLGLEGGGSVAHTAGVIDGLLQCGRDVHVMSSDRLAGVSAPTTITQPEVWFDGWLREFEELAYNVPFLLSALRVARKTRPHAIYQRHTTFSVAGALLSRLLRVPLVLEFNSSELWKGRYWGGLRLRRAAAIVERINLRAADRVIVVSRVLEDELVKTGVQADKIVVNPNAVDPWRFRPDDGGARIRRRLGFGSDVVVGFSGTFGAWHGIPTLARALPLVARARGGVRWLLIGDGPLCSLVDAAVEQGHLGEAVHRAGMVPHGEMPAYLSACDILVSPHGRQADGGEFFGSPTKLFEYMAMGRPIVASAVGQIADVLGDGKTALLVPPDDADALAQAIVRLVDDACLRLQLGRAARQASEVRHTWAQNAQRVLACLGGAA